MQTIRRGIYHGIFYDVFAKKYELVRDCVISFASVLKRPGPFGYLCNGNFRKAQYFPGSNQQKRFGGKWRVRRVCCLGTCKIIISIVTVIFFAGFSSISLLRRYVLLPGEEIAHGRLPGRDVGFPTSLPFGGANSPWTPRHWRRFPGQKGNRIFGPFPAAVISVQALLYSCEAGFANGPGKSPFCDPAQTRVLFSSQESPTD